MRGDLLSASLSGIPARWISRFADRKTHVAPVFKVVRQVLNQYSQILSHELVIRGKLENVVYIPCLWEGSRG